MKCEGSVGRVHVDEAQLWVEVTTEEIEITHVAVHVMHLIYSRHHTQNKSCFSQTHRAVILRSRLLHSYKHDRHTALHCRKKPKHSKAQSTMPTSRDVRDKP